MKNEKNPSASTSYEPRFYRTSHAEDLHECRVVAKETDLQVLADISASKASEFTQALHEIVTVLRADIEDYALAHPEFLVALEPIEVRDAPRIVCSMAQAGKRCNVGPMAAVAGAMAHYLAQAVSCEELIIENGGDLYVRSAHERTVALWTGVQGGASIGLRIDAASMPLAIATSSGKIGHSLSFGEADAVTVLAKDGALADAAATAAANRIHSANDIQAALEFLEKIEGILGAVIVVDGSLGAWGEVVHLTSTGAIL